MTNPEPLTDKEFSNILGGLGIGPKDGPFAVAVSGGPDSMALALLFSKFAEAQYLTFDHGLRPDSAGEANQVHDWLEAKGLSHNILKWTGEKPKTGIQAAARKARYQAMEGWCNKNQVKYLTTAHHMEDQAETFLMRLFKGSGIDGLSAMALKSAGLTESEITLLRPLLGVSRERLKATLKAQKQEWLEDPSNENLSFTRIKIRKLLESSGDLDHKTLAATAGRLAKVKGFLDDLTENLLAQVFEIHSPGYGVLDRARFLKAPSEIALRALSKSLVFISQSDYPPSLEKLERLFNSLQKPEFRGATLQGCQISYSPEKRIMIGREARDAAEVLELKPGEERLWDRRFKVVFKGGDAPFKVKALGERGWQNLAREDPAVKEIDIPHPVRASLPAFFRGGEVILVPHLNFLREDFQGKAEFKPKNRLFQEIM